MCKNTGPFFNESWHLFNTKTFGWKLDESGDEYNVIPQSNQETIQIIYYEN